MKIQKIEITQLKPAEYNPRADLQPEDAAYKKIKRSIEQFGYVDPVIINADNTVIGGHQRLKVLSELGYTEIECVVVNLDKAQEKALNIALNKITGEWDMPRLKDLLEDLDTSAYDLTLTGFDIPEIEDIMTQYNDEDEADDDFDEENALEEIGELPFTRYGDIYIIGEKHRLMCGDATEPNDFDKLMDKQEANLTVTDPPYNVDYEGAAGKIINDRQTDDAFRGFLLSAFSNIYHVSKSGAAIYIFHADSEGLNFRYAFKEAGFNLKQCLVWAKNHFVMGRQDYHWKHEPVLYGWKDGAAHYFINDRTQTTIIEHDRPEKSIEHPTMKPVSLVGRFVNNSSKADWIVLDPFGGSGSTLMACEQLKRICYTMELEPKFCDVIVKRYISWCNEHGKTPKVTLLRNGEPAHCPLIETTE